MLLADNDDSPDEDCIDDDNSSDLEDGEVDVDKKDRKIFPDDEDDCEGINDSDDDEEESGYVSEQDYDEETEIQDKLIEATLK